MTKREGNLINTMTNHWEPWGQRTMKEKTLSLFIEIRKAKESLDKSNLNIGVQDTTSNTVLKFSENFNVCTVKRV